MNLVKLGEVADFIRGVSYKPHDLVSNFSENSIVCMRTANVQKKLDESNLLSIPFDFVKNQEKHLQEGDILVSTANSWNLVGKCSWIPKLAYPATAGGFISILRAKDEFLNRKYLYHWFNSERTQIQARNCGRQTTNISNMDLGRALDLKIPLPPLSEQKRIADILDKADELRQKRQQSIAKLDELLQATFIDMFGDPVTNPKGWEVEKLKQNIIHSNNGLSRRRKETENVGEIVLRLQDVHYDGIHYEKDLNRISLDDSEKQRFKVDSGDILFIRVNGNPEYVGRSAVFSGFNEDIYHNDHLIRIKVSEEYNPYFLSYSFNSSSGKKIISKYVKTSAGQHTISQGGIESMDFIIPPRDLQDIFEHKAKKIQIHKNLLTQQLNKQNQLFQSLQHQAFNGTL